MENREKTMKNNASKELVNSLIKNEYKTILGKNSRGLYILVTILAVTFISLGHGFEGLIKLDESMNNPFTNWVNLNNIGENNITTFNKKIGEDPEKYGIKNIKKYTRTYWEILRPELNKKEKVTLRNVGTDDPIFDIIIEKDNIVELNENASFEQCGIIVKKEMLELYGYSNLSTTDQLAIIYPNKEYDHIVILDIYAIVKELPNEVDMVIPSQVASLEFNGADFINLARARNLFFLSKNKISLIDLKPYNLDKIEEVIETESDYSYNGTKYFSYEMFLTEKVSYAESIEIIDSVKSKFKCINISPPNCSPIEENFSYSYIAYNFNDLSKINEFSMFAKSEGVEIPLHQVKSKENFLLVSSLAKLFIILLVLFSTFSIGLYLKNTLQNHLENIKPNLGTLKAFGLKDSTITWVYLYIIYRFYIISSIIAFAISIVYYMVNKNLEFMNFFFNIFDYKILIVWIIIGCRLFLFYKTSVTKILNKAPGDLIYNR